MKRLITTLCLTIYLACGSFGVGWSGDLEMCFQMPSKDNETSAIDECVPLSEIIGDDAERLTFMGSIYANGKGGIAQNYEKAITLFTLAAEQGYPPAQFYLATMYADGEGVTQDHKEAIRW